MAVFYKPMMYVVPKKADGTVDTANVIAINPTRFTSDGLTTSFRPQTYDDETAAGTFTYDKGTTEGNTISGVIKFLNMYEVASLANGGQPATDKLNGKIEFGNANACAEVRNVSVAIIDLCDKVNTYKMWKIDNAHMSIMTDDLTLGGDDALQFAFTIYAHPGDDGSAAATWGTTDPTQVFDPTTWTVKAPASGK